MTHQVLSNCLRPVIDAETRWRKRRLVTFGLVAGTLVMITLVIIARTTGWWSSPLALLTVIGTVLAVTAGWIWLSKKEIDLKTLSKQVEAEHPDLNALLLTAMDMDLGPEGRLGYLQSQVLSKVTEHAIKNRWVRKVSSAKLIRSGWYMIGAVTAFLLGFWMLVGQIPALSPADIATEEIPGQKITSIAKIKVGVTPGDIEVEKGSRVVVEATFENRIPPGALLVLSDPGDGTIRGRIPMKAGLDDSVFSAIVAKVDSNTKYEVRFEESASDRFLIETYEHPELVQADATITPPAYSEKPVRTVEDTRKISLLEGSHVDWNLKISKPVAAAELFGEDESIIKLKPSKEDPTVLVAAHTPDETQKYRLHLVDKKDRANKRPPWFTVTVKKNLPPKLEFAFPKRDVNVSQVEELSVEARIWDDLGVESAGIVFAYGENKKEVVLADNSLPGEEKHELGTMLAIEELGAKPRDLITYHLWAEDLDREGKLRRTQSEMFLAEVRHFEDIFRESQSQGGGGGEPGESEKLLKLQKDILNATWKVLREAHLGKTFASLQNDIEVVKESQIIAIGQTVEAIQKVEDPEIKKFFEEAKVHMETAVEHFTIPADPFKGPQQEQSPAEPLELALTSVRGAYESLIKARAREHNITQSPPSAQGSPQEKEQQLMNLELKQKDLRYKENSSADPAQTAEQKENLEVLNKLKELARRQEAIAKKIKELQNQLEEAESEEEKKQIEK
ncbi:MAG: hypothetical protein P1V20_20045, partial [Verrucomicrobiales bacterium]|nr:hypothetical protein [Verrucomicrobiales bacterium]